MNLSNESIDWIKKTTNVLKHFSKRNNNYIAFEGLPCAGKTSVIDNLKQLREYYLVDEVRLPQSEESCLAYILKERDRAKRIKDYDSTKKIIGDRSIISTLAHKATLLTYESPVDYNVELIKLEKIARNDEIILPQRIILLDVSTELSRARQSIRERENLEGRLWYEPNFLEIMTKSTKMIIGELYVDSETYFVDSQNQSLNEVTDEIKKILQVIK